MKKIILIRHGRAEDQGYDIPDFQRSLTAKGKSVCAQMAGKLKDTEKNPGLFITSPAFRALETALIFAEGFGISAEAIVLDSNLYYHMDMRYLRKLLSGLGDDINTITLFGHNPSFSNLAAELSNEGFDMLPKTGIAGISFKAEKWIDIRTGSGKMEFFLKPEKSL
ncbi:MAG: histidine phosphatase family protein [Marinilabiliales bacterium]|nr:histidine phosphatase family protein [Marinilabiliales bacterium]